MKHIKRAIQVLLPLGAVLMVAAKTGLLPSGTPLDYFAPAPSFARHWIQKLRHCGNTAAAQEALLKNKEGGRGVTMDDGTWVAVAMEHDCCTGAGFNATVYVTSLGGAFVDSNSCYCGFLPLGEELYGYDRRSIPAFLASVEASGKHLVQP
ncbi:MAG: hypothetical protein V4726_17235 [Verrucomicrobiota bacterium]